mmetsp:Transcript_14773/g.28596  ORF Transcript_14773/g.28596 Transcript_14773/m.28596 type:complete len:316 (-) Transcript_14773:615-1562(-)
MQQSMNLQAGVGLQLQRPSIDTLDNEIFEDAHVQRYSNHNGQQFLGEENDHFVGEGRGGVANNSGLEFSFPPGFIISERPPADAILTVHHAIWFLNVLERSNMEELTPENKERIEKSTLRVKPKHRTAILFEDDVHFVLESEHHVTPESSVIAMCSAPNAAAAAAAAASNQTRRPSLRKGSDTEWKSRSRSSSSAQVNDGSDGPTYLEDSETGSGVEVDRRMVLIRQACKDVIGAYERSIRSAPERSCIWSALMHRAEYHLRESGHTDTRIIENDDPKQESMLELEGHRISRSNFTKIARQFCVNWNKDTMESSS